MLITHVLMICPKCGQEIERFSDEKDGTEIVCTACGTRFEIGHVPEILQDW
jgi:DNA-directed RNA polymerase subunit RPC12/RpoP